MKLLDRVVAQLLSSALIRTQQFSGLSQRRRTRIFMLCSEIFNRFFSA